MKPSHVKPGTVEKLGAKLERDRLTSRARRVTAVIATLRRQAGEPDVEPHAQNRHIHQAITEFEAEVAAINTRLSDLAAGPFDWFIASDTAFALIERLPSAVTRNVSNPDCRQATEVGIDKMYTQVIRQVPVRPDVWHHVDIALTRHNRDAFVLAVGRVPVPTPGSPGAERLNPGADPAESRCCRRARLYGQGARGSFDNFTTLTIPASD